MKYINMRTCGKCGQEYNAADGPCDRCKVESLSNTGMYVRKAAQASGLTEDELIRRELGIEAAERESNGTGA